MRIMTVFGTRPEAIKLAPLVREFQKSAGIEHTLCVTGQHRQMLDQVLQVFGLVPDYDINLMVPGQTLTHVTSSALEGVGRVLDEVKPEWLIVQGDTTTAFAAALAAFYRNVKVAHVEAGLRSGNMYSPWPEELNRRLISVIATLHFPPTAVSRQKLLDENVPDGSICVTGNTVIDALHWMDEQLSGSESVRQKYEAALPPHDPAKRLILVTGHRRENFDGGLAHVCKALVEVADRGDVEIVYPVHLNPKVQETVNGMLGGHDSIFLIDPQEYAPFVALMRRAYLIVTDSGGIQEEGPALGKPVLVTRDTTERPEAITAGVAWLVGTDSSKLVEAVTTLLDEPARYEAMAKVVNPFGDGHASERIVQRLLQYGDGR
jgi:UDP-N-acetylglucosamine 2-epimerase